MADFFTSSDRYYKRRLPHWTVPHARHFITFNTYDRRILSPKARDSVFEQLLVTQKFEVDEAVVMPEHVHALFQVPAELHLSALLGPLKGRLARQINLLENRTGFPVWQEETYDHVVRNDQDLEELSTYIAQNPVEASLAGKPSDYRWYYSACCECCDWAKRFRRPT